MARAKGLKVSCPVALDLLSNSVETKKTHKNQYCGKSVKIRLFLKKSQIVLHLDLCRETMAESRGRGFRIIVATVFFAIAIAMLVVGVLNQEACKNDGAKFLVVNGSFHLVVFIVVCIFRVWNSSFYSNQRFPSGTIPIYWGMVPFIPWFIILIWGSVTVFGKLFYWIYKFLHD